MFRRGLKGEQIAAEYLLAQGYKIIARNFHFRQREVDIIADDAGVLCFIEVKYYHKDSLRDIYEAVDENKQKNIISTAEYYLAKKQIVDKQVRFDTVLIAFDDKNSVSSIELFKDAFRP